MLDLHLRQMRYIFLAQTSDNQKTLFDAVLNLYKDKKVERVLICGEGEKTGYPGFRKWQAELISLGVKQKDIFGLKTIDGTINTLFEAESLIKLAKKERWETIYAVSAPFHQIRAFITLVSVLKKFYLSFRIFNKPAEAMPWNKSVLHSQGILKAPRSEIIQHELERIKKYYKQGDLISFSEVLDYLNKRDIIHQ